MWSIPREKHSRQRRIRFGGSDKWDEAPLDTFRIGHVALFVFVVRFEGFGEEFGELDEED